MGRPEATLTRTSVKLLFEKPSLAIEDGRHRLTVWIDRFNQQSTITLETWKNSRTPDFEFQWLRMGSCEYQILGVTGMAMRFLTIPTGRNLPKIQHSHEPEPSIINEKAVTDLVR